MVHGIEAKRMVMAFTIYHVENVIKVISKMVLNMAMVFLQRCKVYGRREIGLKIVLFLTNLH